MKMTYLITSIVLYLGILLLLFMSKEHFTAWQYIIMFQLFLLINKE